MVLSLGIVGLPQAHSSIEIFAERVEQWLEVTVKERYAGRVITYILTTGICGIKDDEIVFIVLKYQVGAACS